MKQFIKFTFATVIGLFLFMIISTFLLIGIGSAFSGEDEVTTISENSILELDLSSGVKDNPQDDPFSMLDLMQSGEGKTLKLLSVLENIEKAKLDENIKGIVISNGIVSGGLASITSIRKKLLDFKTSGKFIVSYSDIYTQKGYYLCSVADTIFVTPVGKVEFKGLAAELKFYKNLQDKFGIKYDIIRHGKFKSAVEPYLSDKMSDANRLQTTKLLTSVWDNMLEDISASRNISVEELNTLADNRATNLISGALSSGLIDKAVYEDEFFKSVNNAIGKDDNTELDLVSFSDYTKVEAVDKKEYSRDKIAILYAEGEIVYEGGPNMGGGIKPSTMLKAIRKLRTNDKVKGVVLRVNSPGGSALTSDLIWRELELLKKEKPFVVSFGDVAASGGYYIACGADKIYAQKNTITGSIGVFGMLPNLEKAAKNIGITSEVIQTNKNSFDLSLTKAASPELKNFILKGVEQTYKEFVTRVSEGRKMKFEDVDAIGQGRVWSATDALPIGLIDEIGGLQDAISFIAEKAEVENFRLVSYPEKEDPFEKMFETFNTQARQSVIKYEIGEEAYKLYSDYKTFTSQEGLQMRIPYNLDIN